MNKLLTTIAAAAITVISAQAELNPKQFDQLKDWATAQGYVYDGIAKRYNCFVFSHSNGITALVPTTSDTANEAINALIGSIATHKAATEQHAPSTPKTAQVARETEKPTYDKAWTASWFLFKSYDQNPIAADAKYRYQTIVVVGTVKNIGRDILGNPYVVLNSSNKEYSLGGVQCTFAVEDEAEIANISEGQKVAISGEVKGLVLFNVQIDGCQFTTLPVEVKKTVAAN